jgi:hypothetical protein
MDEYLHPGGYLAIAFYSDTPYEYACQNGGAKIKEF